MRKRYYVVLEDGGQRYPMKKWLRSHPEELPPNYGYPEVQKQSRQLRSALKRMGWVAQETDTQVLLSPPEVQKDELDLLDQFATAALTGLSGRQPLPPLRIAKVAYGYAKEMVKLRRSIRRGDG